MISFLNDYGTLRDIALESTYPTTVCCNSWFCSETFHHLVKQTVQVKWIDSFIWQEFTHSAYCPRCGITNNHTRVLHQFNNQRHCLKKTTCVREEKRVAVLVGAFLHVFLLQNSQNKAPIYPHKASILCTYLYNNVFQSLRIWST